MDLICDIFSKSRSYKTTVLLLTYKTFPCSYPFKTFRKPTTTV
jgi:hypothetical protein